MNTKVADSPLLPLVVDTTSVSRHGTAGGSGSAESFNAWLDRARKPDNPPTNATGPSRSPADEARTEQKPHAVEKQADPTSEQLEPSATANDLDGSAIAATGESNVESAEPTPTAVDQSVTEDSPQSESDEQNLDDESSNQLVAAASGLATTVDFVVAETKTGQEAPAVPAQHERGKSAAHGKGKEPTAHDESLPANGNKKVASDPKTAGRTADPIQKTSEATVPTTNEPRDATPVESSDKSSDPQNRVSAAASKDVAMPEIAGVDDTAVPQEVHAEAVGQVLVVDAKAKSADPSQANAAAPSIVPSADTIVAATSNPQPQVAEQHSTRIGADRKTPVREKVSAPSPTTASLQPADVALAQQPSEILSAGMAGESPAEMLTTSEISTDLPPGSVDTPAAVEGAAIKTVHTATASPMGESSGRAKADASLEALSGGTKSTTPSVNHERTLSDIERVRFVQRVARAMHTSVDRGGELSLRLSPPELGSLRLQVSLREGAMQVRLEAETNAARGALLDNLPLLRERLAEQNIRIDKFDVDLRQPGDNTSAGGFADRSPEDALPGKSQRGNRPKAAASAAGSAAAIRTMRPHPDGQLNIIV